MRSLRIARSLFQVAFPHQTSLLLAARFMSDRKHWEPVIEFDVAVTACESNTDSRNASIHPSLIAYVEDLSQPVSRSAASKLELFRYAFAFQ